MRQIIILCSTAVLLAGCSIYKPYSRPDTGVEADSLYGPGVTVEDTASIAARSAFYPGITLSGSAGWTNNVGNVISNPGNWLLSALGSLTQPLFNRGRNIASLRIAKAQQKEALLSFRQSLLKAGNEVNDALMQWQTADSRLKIIGGQETALQPALNNTRKLMEYSSSSSYLEVLTAQQTLLQAELTEANDRFDKIQGVINLYHALGGGAE